MLGEKIIQERKKHYAYMLRCSDGSIYSGYTTDPHRREKVHNSGKGAKYTRTRLPVKLVYFEEFDNKIDAMKWVKIKRSDNNKLSWSITETNEFLWK